VEVELLQSWVEEVVFLEPAAAAAVAVAVAVVAGPGQRLESGLPPLKEMGATSQCHTSTAEMFPFFVPFSTGLCVDSHRHQHLKTDLFMHARVSIKKSAWAKVKTVESITRVFGHSGGLHDWYLLLFLSPESPPRRALRSRGKSTCCSHYSTSTTLLLRPSLHRGLRCRGSSRSSCCWLDLLLLHRPSTIIPSLLIGRSCCCCCCCCLTADRGGEGSLLEGGQPS
jgi:hypothetical protein